MFGSKTLKFIDDNTIISKFQRKLECFLKILKNEYSTYLPEYKKDNQKAIQKIPRQRRFLYDIQEEANE